MCMEKAEQSKRSWVHKEIQNIISAFSALKLWQCIVAGIVFVVAIGFSQSIGEFLVALQNRYATYPAGTDTNMYARSGALSAIVSLSAAWLIAYIFKMATLRWYIVAGLLLLSILVSIYDLPVWLGWIMMLAHLATIVGASIGTKILLFVPILGYIILLLSFNSIVPEEWCKYELTMYRCPENIEYYINPDTGEKIIDRKQ